MFKRRKSSDRVRLGRTLWAQDQELPPGDYEVTVREEDHQLSLEGAGRAIVLSASVRQSKMRVSTTSVQLRDVAGEDRQLLVVRTPPGTEWVVSLETRDVP